MKRKQSELYEGSVKINVGGKIFTLCHDAVLAQPKTKIGRALLEGKARYFDRSPDFFPTVQEFYRTGVVPLSKIKLGPEILMEELAYWEIPLPSCLRLFEETFDQIKCRVKKYCDGFLIGRERTMKNVNLFFESFPSQQVCWYKGSDNKIKKFDSRKHKSLNKEIISLFEMTKYENLPLNEIGNGSFLCPIEETLKHCKIQSDLHPVIRSFYLIFCAGFREYLKCRFGAFFPAPLIEIMTGYFLEELNVNNPINPEYLIGVFALYANIIDGAKLFDDDDNPDSCALARRYATRYFDEKGIKSEWMTIMFRCDDSRFVLNYPLHSLTHEKFRPGYKCLSCCYNNLCAPINCAGAYSVRYLHFEWGLNCATT